MATIKDLAAQNGWEAKYNQNTGLVGLYNPTTKKSYSYKSDQGLNGVADSNVLMGALGGTPTAQPVNMFIKQPVQTQAPAQTQSTGQPTYAPRQPYGDPIVTPMVNNNAAPAPGAGLMGASLAGLGAIAAPGVVNNQDNQGKTFDVVAAKTGTGTPTGTGTGAVPPPAANTNTDYQIDPILKAKIDEAQKILDSLFGQGYNSPYTQQAQNAFTQYQNMVNKGFNYNPDTDTVLQGDLKSTSKAVEEEMNRRGILNSTVTQDSISPLAAKLINEYRNQAYDKYQSDVDRQLQVANYFKTLDNDEYRKYTDKIQQAYDYYNYLTGLDDRGRKLLYDAQDRKYTQKLSDLKVQAETLNVENEKINNAFNRVKATGKVDNEAAIIFGVPVGTSYGELYPVAYERIKKAEDNQANVENEIYKTYQTKTIESEINKGLETHKSNLRITEDNNKANNDAWLKGIDYTNDVNLETVKTSNDIKKTGVDYGYKSALQAQSDEARKDIVNIQEDRADGRQSKSLNEGKEQTNIDKRVDYYSKHIEDMFMSNEQTFDATTEKWVATGKKLISDDDRKKIAAYISNLNDQGEKAEVIDLLANKFGTTAKDLNTGLPDSVLNTFVK